MVEMEHSQPAESEMPGPAVIMAVATEARDIPLMAGRQLSMDLAVAAQERGQ